MGAVVGNRPARRARVSRRADARARHDDSLSDVLSAAFALRSTDEWLDALTAAGVAAVEPSPVNMHPFMNDPENRRTGRVAEVADPERGNVREIVVLVRVSDADVPPHRPHPHSVSTPTRSLPGSATSPTRSPNCASWRGAVTPGWNTLTHNRDRERG